MSENAAKPTNNQPLKLTVVVPTRNEQDNVGPLTKRIERALAPTGYHPYEILFVDDSDDETPEAVARLAAQGKPVRIIHREGTDREGGLATAVVSGFTEARGELIASLDADLQHPPEKLVELLNKLNDADVAVGSRYIPGGSPGGLAGPVRRAGSIGTKLLARLLFSRARLSTDPMSGFFALRKEAIEGVELRPIGFKILLEVLVRGNVRRVADVPYAFEERTAGQSKADLKQIRLYLRHLLRLRLGDPGPRWILALVPVAVLAALRGKRR